MGITPKQLANLTKKLPPQNHVPAVGKMVKAAEPKYKNKRVFYDGRWFDSIAERERYKTLRNEQNIGGITDLRMQVEFKLQASNGDHITTYRADFTYYTNEGIYVVEDVKGKTAKLRPEFVIKAKLFAAQFGFEISIVRM